MCNNIVTNLKMEVMIFSLNSGSPGELSVKQPMQMYCPRITTEQSLDWEVTRPVSRHLV